MPVIFLLFFLTACSELPGLREEKATTSLKEQALEGNLQAQYLLAEKLCCGLGKNYDNEQAVNWWCHAARRGYAPAQFEVGRIYQEDELPLAVEDKYASLYVGKNNFVAMAWYTLAVQQGYEPANSYYSLLGKRLTDVQKQQVYELMKNPGAIPCRYGPSSPLR